MKTYTKQEVKNGAGFSSQDLRDQILDAMKEDEIVINFAYTDYGGDFFDKIVCEYFQDKEDFLVEDTSYYGQNGWLLGKTAKTFNEVSQYYLLGYEDIEDFYYNRQYEEETKGFQMFLEDLEKYDSYKIQDTALDFLLENRSGYYNVLTTGVDFSSSELEEYLIENNQIEKIEE
jgi:hypothetical protein